MQWVKEKWKRRAFMYGNILQHYNIHILKAMIDVVEVTKSYVVPEEEGGHRHNKHNLMKGRDYGME